ncbi:MAG: riboflavin synthase [Alphaproteobacteria bacterium]|jgi:riboflavin synthase
MFTGIVTDVGRVSSVDAVDGGRRLVIETAFDMNSVDIGASIACSGTCLTVVDKGAGWFAADVSGETLSCTTLGSWEAGGRVNLERSLTPSSELGGHMVLGHVDGVGKIAGILPDGESRRVEIDAPAELSRFIAAKGSVSVDGVSLTVNRVDGDRFELNIIPHTWEHTVFADYVPGSRVNLEVDVIARYAARLLERS